MEPLKKTRSSNVSDGTATPSGMSAMASGAFPEERKTRDARAKAFALEDAMLKEGDHLDLPINHYQIDGVYVRTMFIPAGVVVVGKIHKYPQINICSMGSVTIVMDEGPERINAGWHKVCPAGAKRSFFAHVDSIWTTVHRTDETDVEKIEEDLVTNSEEEYIRMLENKQ